MLTPQIIEKPSLSVVGYQAAFIHALSPDSNTTEVIVPLWERILDDGMSVPNRASDVMYGVIHGRPQEERSHPDELLYIAAAHVETEPEQLPEGMVFYTVPAHLCAVVEHRGPIQNIGNTCHALYREWLPKSEYEHAGVADVEMYDERFDGHSEGSVMEYAITIKPKEDT